MLFVHLPVLLHSAVVLLDNYVFKKRADKTFNLEEKKQTLALMEQNSKQLNP